MLEFLWNDLYSVNRTEYPWIILYTHRPLYCSLTLIDPERPYYSEDEGQNYVLHENHIEDCTSNSMLLRSKFEKLWFDFKVDLVITAYVHLYERAYPVYNSEYKGCEGITVKGPKH